MKIEDSFFSTDYTDLSKRKNRRKFLPKRKGKIMDRIKKLWIKFGRFLWPKESITVNPIPNLNDYRHQLPPIEEWGIEVIKLFETNNETGEKLIAEIIHKDGWIKIHKDGRVVVKCPGTGSNWHYGEDEHIVWWK